MRGVLLISDLHLDPTRPAALAALARLLDQYTPQLDALYVLGDLFEAYLGDDDPAPHVAEVATVLGRVADAGAAVGLMHGNRDFLIGQAFAIRTGASLLPDPLRVELYGHSALLSHGDSWCTDDVTYQQVRSQVRSHDWQHQFLAHSLAQRQQFAAQARDASRAHTRDAHASIMDVNADAVAAAARDYRVNWLIHGHTHRPADHRTEALRRTVLGDWPEHAAGAVLWVGADGSTRLGQP